MVSMRRPRHHFSAWIMMKFKKGYNLKIFSLAIGILLLSTSMLYSQEALRVPMGLRDRQEETLGPVAGEDAELINRLSDTDTRIIDAALKELDRIPDAGRVREIIEAVFKDNDLEIDIPKSDEYEKIVFIMIKSIKDTGGDDNIVGFCSFEIESLQKKLIFKHNLLRGRNIRGRRFLPMLLRLISAHLDFRFSGWKIEVVLPNPYTARAWWRSGFSVTVKKDGKIIRTIDEITEDGKYDITGTFLTWKDSLEYGSRTTDPKKHIPQGMWAYLAHTGAITGHYNLLRAFYEDLENAHREIFCCMKVTPSRPRMWLSRPVGLLLNIERRGEVLYAGDTRGSASTIYPLERPAEEIEFLKMAMREKSQIDFRSSGRRQKEMDITGAEIEGVCIGKGLGFVLRDGGRLSNFTLLMAIAIKYDLPIVFLTNVSDSKKHERLYRSLERALKRHKRAMFNNLKTMAESGHIDFSEIRVQNENELVAAIMRQITPQPSATLPSVREQLLAIPQTDL